jgi:hypothetical protein
VFMTASCACATPMSNANQRQRLTMRSPHKRGQCNKQTATPLKVHSEHNL